MNAHEESIFRKTFTECSGCGCSDPTQKDWANITVQISAGTGTKYIPIGKYCPLCKDRTWAYRGHGTDNPEWLFTAHELCVAQGLGGQNHLDNPEVIEWLKKELSSDYPESVTCNLTWAQAYAKIAVQQSVIEQMREALIFFRDTSICEADTSVAQEALALALTPNSSTQGT